MRNAILIVVGMSVFLFGVGATKVYYEHYENQDNTFELDTNKYDPTHEEAEAMCTKLGLEYNREVYGYTTDEFCY